MFNDLRGFIKTVEELGECKEIEEADWDLEIGFITEWQARFFDSPLLLFDKIKGYEPGYRVVSNLYNTPKRTALALGLPLEGRGIELVRELRDKFKEVKLVPPVEVENAPVKENIHLGDDVDLFMFPVPKWHKLDGGRYIGTGHAVIQRDPDDGWVNLGAYRVQAHDRSIATIHSNPGRHGTLIRQKYWDKGLSCPAAVATGLEPVLWAATTFDLPLGVSEYDYTGGFRGKAIEVTQGVTTDLPIPATAEIVLEGEILPNEVKDEGPFGEWAGYYVTGVLKEPVFKVNAILHRNNPIIHGAAPVFAPASANTLGHQLRRSALAWTELDRHVPGVKGVWLLDYPGYCCMVIVSVEQKYHGHAKQAAMAIASLNPTSYLSRFIIIVDDDIDPSNMMEVLWALATRCDPETAIDVVRGLRGSAADTLLTPEMRSRGEYSHSAALMLACKPYQWFNQFPPSIASDSDDLKKTADKWGKFFSQP